MHNFLKPQSLKYKNKIKSEINVTPFVDAMSWDMPVDKKNTIEKFF